MAKKARTKRNEKIRRLAVEGYTRQQIGRIVHLHPPRSLRIRKSETNRGGGRKTPHNPGDKIHIYTVRKGASFFFHFSLAIDFRMK